MAIYSPMRGNIVSGREAGERQAEQLLFRRGVTGEIRTDE
jgi:hypothetical protein